MKFFKKYHKWLGIVLTLFILLFALSGIVLNHRDLFSGIDVNREKLSDDYHYNHWNHAAVKGTLQLSGDSVLVYGNVGVWLTDSSFRNYKPLNAGFNKGVDNRKINCMAVSPKSDILAGTLFGLFKYNTVHDMWHKVEMPLNNEQVVDLEHQGDTLLVLTRSHLYYSTDMVRFTQKTIPPPCGYDNKVGLFKTLWMIHSGELFGLMGQLFTDFLGLVFIFLSITGLIYFIAPKIIRKRKRKSRSVKKVVKLNRFSLKWHNKLGWTLVLFLMISTLTGMFLRPPLLIAIYQGKINKIPFTTLNNDNAWYDKLRQVIYDEYNNRYIFATNEGLFFANISLDLPVIPINNQPPVSVMGVNVFEQISKSMYLVGSFEGLFVWDEATRQVYDYIEQRVYRPSPRRGAPIGKHMVAGFTRDYLNSEVVFDYNTGAGILNSKHPFPNMPGELQKQPMSLWNFALEVHTARIYSAIFGDFYILIIPLAGLSILFILISGFIVWYKKYHKPKQIKKGRMK